MVFFLLYGREDIAGALLAGSLLVDSTLGPYLRDAALAWRDNEFKYPEARHLVPAKIVMAAAALTLFLLGVRGDVVLNVAALAIILDFAEGLSRKDR